MKFQRRVSGIKLIIYIPGQKQHYYDINQNVEKNITDMSAM